MKAASEAGVTAVGPKASSAGLSIGVATSASAPASSTTASSTLSTPPVAPIAALPASAVVAAASAPASSIAQVTPAASEPLSVPKAASAPAAAPPAEEPSLIDTLADNPLVLPGAGLLLAVLAGLGWYRLRGKNKNEEGVTSFLESRLQPDSFFGASGGQRIDTRDATGAPSSMSYSLSQIDAIGDVDPVAEADVYLAYGRDLQAEEILKEAMRANPDRLAIRTKLLEVYAKRRDIKGFELLAGELYGLTGGQGEEWTKTQELGRSIDPENTLYEPGGAPNVPTGSGNLEPLGASTMPQSIVPSPSRYDSVEPDVSLDEPAPSGSSAAVDLDISVPAAIDEPRSSRSSGFGRGTGSSQLDSMRQGIDFDTSDMPTAGAHSAPAPAVDLGGISLDLDALPSTGHGNFSQPSAPLDLPPIDEDGTDPLARKIELAEEFRQIGDTEGARDLLQEVVERAEGALQAKARSMLEQLS
jgi:pilus assembly protein FimV